MMEVLDEGCGRYHGRGAPGNQISAIRPRFVIPLSSRASIHELSAGEAMSWPKDAKAQAVVAEPRGRA
jgi:hypothetical protein